MPKENKIIKMESAEELRAALHKRLDDMLDSESGFVIMCANKTISDLYHNVCRDCVMNALGETMVNAEQNHLFAPVHEEQSEHDKNVC